jgi:hypothetical protein
MTPAKTRINPPNCLTDIFSPGNKYTRMAICGIIKLLRMNDSTAVNTHRDRIQSVNASAARGS